MKKFIFIFLVCFLFLGNSLFAQKSANLANHNTALRCLKLAENCLMGGDWEGALKQAELGLSYDDSISDLIYVKAASLSYLGSTKAQVLPVIEEAFKKDSWNGYSKTGARLFIADILCDTGLYDESLQYLDSEPFIYSADAEFIRIKNYYRMGTKDSYENARLKINSARRIYPKDVRFPNIFFLFEELSMAIDTIFNNTSSYETDPLVQTIADSYIAKLPDYEDKNIEMELLSAFFARGDQQVRLVKAIDSKNKTKHPLMAILGLKTGLFTQEQAFDYFVEACNGNIPLITFEFFMQHLSSEDGWDKILEYFANFEGSFYIDTNYDLQFELVVDYKTGRPFYITYDADNNGEKEIVCKCDFGVPKNLYLLNNSIEYTYDNYPEVSKVKYSDPEMIINYLYGDFIYYPFKLAKEPFLQIMGLDFFVPAAGSITYPQFDHLGKAVSIEIPGSERENSRVVYSMNEGAPVFAKFYENDVQYAYCDFQAGFPFVRYADYDNDGRFETSETYNICDPSMSKKFTEEDYVISRNIMGPFALEVYLAKVAIDRNGNTYSEYVEEYLENGGIVCSWDNDDNGIIDYQHIKFSKEENEPQKEETIFYNSNGIESVRISIVNGVPVSMKNSGQEMMVYAGNLTDYYWIEDKGPEAYEAMVSEKLGTGVEQGSIEIVNCDDVRVSVIRVDNLYFLRLLPPSMEIEY